MNKYIKSSISVAICLRLNICRSHITTDTLLNSVITDLVITNLVLTNEHTVIRTFGYNENLIMIFRPKFSRPLVVRYDRVWLCIFMNLMYIEFYNYVSRKSDGYRTLWTNVKLRWHTSWRISTAAFSTTTYLQENVF